VARLKVARNASDRPILFLRREQNPPLPHGEVDVVIDGEVQRARFVKVACNVIARPNEPVNLLPEILRRWFGDEAGAPGTDHTVELSMSEASAHLELRPRLGGIGGELAYGQHEREEH
jgi:hypothetical protein